MMNLDLTYILKCITALERASDLLTITDTKSNEYEIYRSASVKEFEIILEQCGKVIKKALKKYYHSPKEVDAFTFKELFRHASHHSIISIDECDRWLKYRDNRNNTAHDYGQGFAESTLTLLPQFIIDAKSLLNSIDLLP